MRGLAAIVADQEDTVVAAPRMGVDQIGIGALDPVGKIGAHEQVEDPVDAVGRDPLAAAGLLYTSYAADDLLCVDLCGRRIIKKKTFRISCSYIVLFTE